MEQIGIGRRVRTLRIQRGMTQQQLADALELSLPWVKAFEGGSRQEDPRFSLLKRLAEVLAVPMSALVENEPTASSASVGDVRTALLTPTPRPNCGTVDVERQTAYGYHAFHAGRWRDILNLLPGLIEGARSAEGGTGDPRALAQLADVCHLAAITLTKLGDTAGGWAAGHEAVLRAEAAGDPVEVALAAQSAAYAATAAGRPDVGLQTVQRVAEEHEAALRAAGDIGVSALGLLYLKGAYAAAGLSDAATAALMIDYGRKLAQLVAPNANHRATTFNITNVAFYEASILGDLGFYDEALDAVTRIDPRGFAAMQRERRMHHLVDTARSAQRAGKPDSALRLLLDAEREDRELFRSWGFARSVLEDLTAGQQPTDGRGLRALAVRAGVAR